LAAALVTLAAPPRGAAAAPDAGVAPADGPPIVFGTRPILDREVRACSFREPLCVHAPASVASGRVLAALSAAETAWQAATWGLDLPPPDIDPSTGAFDVYLVDGTLGAEAVLSERDGVASFDRGRAFLRVDPGLEGCALDASLARETTRAILWRTAPATDPATARAETAYLARLMTPCALEAPGGIDAFQSHPEASVTGSLRGSSPDVLPGAPTTYAEGASLFYWWLDDRFGNSPGGVVRALWALTPTLTPIGSPAWASHPNGFDVLRASFKDALGTGSTLDDLFLDFAVARAFVGATSDAEGMPETRALGLAGGLTHAWDVDWPKTPRALASGRAVEPTGAAYVVVDCGAAPKGGRLRFEAEWEEHAKMRWAVLKLDAAGHERAVVAVPGPERGTAAQLTVVDLDGVARLLFVGTETGDPLGAFDPSDDTPEPHGWVVSVAAEGP